MAAVCGFAVIRPFTLIHGIRESRQRRISLVSNAVRTVIIVIGVYSIIQLVFFSLYVRIVSPSSLSRSRRGRYSSYIHSTGLLQLMFAPLS